MVYLAHESEEVKAAVSVLINVHVYVPIAGILYKYSFVYTAVLAELF